MAEVITSSTNTVVKVLVPGPQGPAGQAGSADLTPVYDAIAAAKDRSNHIGVQLAATVSDLTAAVQAIVAAYLKQGTNVTLVSGTGTLTVNSTASGGTGSVDANAVKDIVGAMISSPNAGLNVNYNSTTKAMVLTAGVQTVAGRQGNVTLTTVDLPDFTEALEDAVAAMIARGTQSGITVTYQDNASGLGSLSFTGGVGAPGQQGPTGPQGPPGPQGPAGPGSLTVLDTPFTANGTLVAGVLNKVDATNGPLTMQLPANVLGGTRIGMVKMDSANTITLSGSVRGSTMTIPATLPFEVFELVTDTSGSWWPIASHKTLSSIQATLAPVALSGLWADLSSRPSFTGSSTVSVSVDASGNYSFSAIPPGVPPGGIGVRPLIMQNALTGAYPTKASLGYAAGTPVEFAGSGTLVDGTTATQPAGENLDVWTRGGGVTAPTVTSTLVGSNVTATQTWSFPFAPTTGAINVGDMVVIAVLGASSGGGVMTGSLTHADATTRALTSVGTDVTPAGLGLRLFIFQADAKTAAATAIVFTTATAITATKFTVLGITLSSLTNPAPTAASATGATTSNSRTGAASGTPTSQSIGLSILAGVNSSSTTNAVANTATTSAGWTIVAQKFAPALPGLNLAIALSLSPTTAALPAITFNNTDSGGAATASYNVVRTIGLGVTSSVPARLIWDGTWHQVAAGV